ncbi:MAG: hypothetical protein IPL92_19685 [Saprospiraceae bacterium]|nr:hypothetical protein [Candidatus Opimibacter iunctus]
MLNMNRIASLVIFFLISIWNAKGQSNVEWAGPDKESCGEKGVQLGASTPCPGCCFLWSNAEDLDSATIQNPVARPKKGTTYTVTVTDEKLSWKKIDAVKVDLSFGEIHFIPDHLEQGTEEIVLAKLQKNNGNFSTTWSFQGDDLGCTIEPTPGDYNHATLTPGDEYGKLQVKVHKNADPECYFVETLPVNNGVKDLKAIDLNNPNRFAETGQTLYLISNDPVDWKARLIAIPNEGGFANGNPVYKADSYNSPTPLSDEEDQVVEDVATISGKYSKYIAGDFPDFDPMVTVIRKIPEESPSGLPALAQNLYNFWQDLEQRLNFDDLNIEAPGSSPTTPPCPEVSPFSFEGNFGIGYKTTEVEKYNDPGIGEKKECTIDATINIVGKIYHPALTRHFVIFGIGVCSEVSAYLEAITGFHMGITSDESLPDDKWVLGDPQFELTIGGGVGFSAVLLSGTGYNLQASGSAGVSCKTFIDFKTATAEFVATTKLFPVTIKVEAVVVNTTNMGEFKPLFNLLSKEFVLYKGFETTPLVLYDFNNQ